MVLAGLVIALGEVVDDAIIDVENIVRRLRLNRAAGSPQSAFQVVLDASLEVRSAVVYASLIVVARVPAGLLPRRAGRARSSARWRWPTSWPILASLLVALTVTPALSLHAAAGRAASGREAPLTRWLKRLYRARAAARSSPGRALAVGAPGRRVRR